MGGMAAVTFAQAMNVEFGRNTLYGSELVGGISAGLPGQAIFDLSSTTNLSIYGQAFFDSALVGGVSSQDAPSDTTSGRAVVQFVGSTSLRLARQALVNMRVVGRNATINLSHCDLAGIPENLLQSTIIDGLTTRASIDFGKSNEGTQ